MEGGTSYREALSKGGTVSVLAVGTAVRCVATLDAGVYAVRAMGVVVDYSLWTQRYIVRVFQIWPCNPALRASGMTSTLTVTGPLNYSSMEHRNPFAHQWKPANAVSFDNGEPMFMSLPTKDVIPWKRMSYAEHLRAHYPHFWVDWKLDEVKCIKNPGQGSFWYGFSKKNFYICQTLHYTLDPLTLDVIPYVLLDFPADGTPILVRKSAGHEDSKKNNARDIMTDPHVISLWQMCRDNAGPYAVYLDEESEFSSWLRVNY
jgi:hypothetical protein